MCLRNQVEVFIANRFLPVIAIGNCIFWYTCAIFSIKMCMISNMTVIDVQIYQWQNPLAYFGSNFILFGRDVCFRNGPWHINRNMKSWALTWWIILKKHKCCISTISFDPVLITVVQQNKNLHVLESIYKDCRWLGVWSKSVSMGLGLTWTKLVFIFQQPHG